MIKQWKSLKQASEELKISKSSISKCCKGKYKKVGGYIWRYKK